MNKLILIQKIHLCLRPYSSSAASLYVHWPYCEKRCSYCNFNKYVSQNIPHKRMLDCLLQETEALIKLSGISSVTSIFFGGGTPSLAKPDAIASIISKVQELVDMSDGIEITMEGNPTSIESRSLRHFKDAGINRFSIGLQALNDKDLKLLGRNHSVEEALESIAETKTLFPGRTSIDIIFGRPYQNLNDWTSELNQIIQLVDGHVSLYQLTLERGTALFKLVKNKIIILAQAGLERYEVSNFSVKGAESRHNMSYWTLDEYIGVGPGAHGRFCARSNSEVNRAARIQTLEPEHWMYEVETKGHGTRKKTDLSNLDLLQELLALGLRLTSGINEENWNRFSPSSIADVFENSQVLEKYQHMELLELCAQNRVLRATDKGIMLLDSMLPDLLLHLQNYYNSRVVTLR